MGRQLIWFCYNWYATNEYGEEFESISVEQGNVEKMEYHNPAGEGDKHYVDVYFKNGISKRYFNLNELQFRSDK